MATCYVLLHLLCNIFKLILRLKFQRYSNLFVIQYVSTSKFDGIAREYQDVRRAYICLQMDLQCQIAQRRALLRLIFVWASNDFKKPEQRSSELCLTVMWKVASQFASPPSDSKVSFLVKHHSKQLFPYLNRRDGF